MTKDRATQDDVNQLVVAALHRLASQHVGSAQERIDELVTVLEVSTDKSRDELLA